MDRTERFRRALAIEAASFKASRDKFDALQPGCRVRNRDNKTAVFIKHGGPMTAQILVDGDSIFSNVGVEGLTVLPETSSVE